MARRSKPKKLAGQGGLEFRNGQWFGKHRVVIDGAKVRRRFPLGTDSESIAEAKNKELAKALKRGEIPKVEAIKAPETFRQAAERMCEQYEREGLITIRSRRQILKDYAYPFFGDLRVDMIPPAKIKEALEARRDSKASKQSVTHLRLYIFGVFDALRRDKAIKENPVELVALPKGCKVDDRPRQILTDEEFALFWFCDDLSLCLRLMALVSRIFGGQRTSDLHAWDWKHIDTRSWKVAKIKRPKTEGHQGGLSTVEIPEALLTPLKSWWLDHGCPKEGPVFPARHGGRRRNLSYAGRLRAGLRKAFGIDRILPDTKGRPRRVQVRELTDRERDLLESGEFSRRVDFHSFRRAFVTALGTEGVNAQLAMRLTGHTSLDTHLGYMSPLTPVAVPPRAIPRLVPKKGPATEETSDFAAE